MTNVEFEAPSGTVRMAIGKGHQAIQGIGYSTYVLKDGKPGVENVKFYDAECVTPPEGTTAEAWIAAGFPGREVQLSSFQPSDGCVPRPSLS